MKLKLDENLGKSCRQLFADAGHDVATVTEQNLSGATDLKVIGVCQAEERGLVTLDLDFSNPLQFNPSQYFGIAVIRLPKNATQMDLIDGIKTLIAALIQNDIKGKLWIIQRGVIRIYQGEL